MKDKNDYRKCTVWLCNRKHYAHGLCKTHLTAFTRYGSVYGKHLPREIEIASIITHARILARTVSYEETEDKNKADLAMVVLKETEGYNAHIPVGE